MKKMLSILLSLSLIFFTPTVSMAAHTHSWGPDLYYKTHNIKPPLNSDDCLTVQVFNKHTCLTCGVTETWVASTYQLEHNYQNGRCVYCGMGYLKIDEPTI